MVNLETILFGPITDKQARFVILVPIAFLLTDTMINNVSDSVVPQTTSKWGISNAKDIRHLNIPY